MKPIISAAFIIFFFSCISAYAFERHKGASPKLNVESEVEPGDAIYSEFDYPARRIVHLQKELAYSKKVKLRSGEILIETSENLFCSEVERPRGWGGGKVCLQDLSGGRSQFTRFFILDGAPAARNKKLTEPVPYAVHDRIAVDPTDVPSWVGEFYRKEIVYQGASGGSLKLLYREYVNNLAREAFSQDLEFDLADEPPTIAIVKGARIEVHDAGNLGIKYTIKKPFR